MTRPIQLPVLCVRSAVPAHRSAVLSSRIAVLFALALPFLPTPGCGAGTGAPIVDASFAIGGSDAARSFATSAGWQVELTEARIVLGPIYALAPRDEVPMALRLWPTSVARAHGGFDALDGRIVRMEVLDQFLVDALAPEPQIIATLAEEGRATELSVGILPPVDRHVEATRGFDVWVEGTARQGETEVPFSGGLDLGDDPMARRVQNIDLDASLAEGGTLQLLVDARVWLDGVDFDRVDGEFALDGQAHAALRVGARRPTAFSATYQAP